MTQSPQDFSMSTSSYPLHLVAEYSDSVELQQILIQLNVSMTKRKVSFKGVNRLGILCRRKQFPATMNMMHCLIEVDKSVAVIENGIRGCSERHAINCNTTEEGFTGHHMLMLINMLLKTNPKAAECDNEYLVH